MLATHGCQENGSWAGGGIKGFSVAALSGIARLMEMSMLDTAWVLLCSGLVFLMEAGFTCLESGLTRTKNSINVAIRNLTDVGFSVVTLKREKIPWLMPCISPLLEHFQIRHQYQCWVYPWVSPNMELDERGEHHGANGILRHDSFSMRGVR